MVLPQQGLDLKTVVAAFENHLVDQALARTNGNKNRASELLMMNRTTLVEKLRKRGMIIPAAQSRAEAMSGEEANLPAGAQAGGASASSAVASVSGPNAGGANGGNANVPVQVNVRGFEPAL
jgi:hypothetical protein